MPQRPLLSRAALALALVFACCCAAAADYPTHPIHLIVPFAPGGGNDTVARLVGQNLGKALGQPVVVDNRPGAGGVVGAEAAARAAPDGYTLFLGGVGSHAINPNLHAHLTYDPIKDFAPISLIAQAPLILVVHPSVPTQSVQALVALARAQPGKLNYASNGNGSSSQLAAVMFESMTGVQMVHVPYKGLSPALQDLLTGQVQLMFSSVVAILPQVQAGKLRALATTGARRMALLPDLPTVAESGVPGYQASSWYGILAPAGTPPDVVAKLNAALVKVVAQPEVRKALAREGAEPVGDSPEAFGAFIREEKQRLGDVIRKAKLPMQD
jgi:tripartite-type tricarboxylate transporter receptor subunit TctC